MAEKNPSRIVIVVADMARAEPTLSSSFVAEFCQRLSRLNPALHLARGWLEQRTLEQGLSVEQLVHQESQSQASDQVSVSHSICEPAFAERDRLEGIRRNAQSGRANVARRAGGCLWRHGFRDARSLSPRR